MLVCQAGNSRPAGSLPYEWVPVTANRSGYVACAEIVNVWLNAGYGVPAEALGAAKLQ